MSDTDLARRSVALDAVVRRHPTTLVRSIGDESLLFQPRTNELIAADPTATHIWNALQTPMTLSDLISIVATDFSVAPDDITNDLIVFVADLTERGALQVEAD